MKFLMQKLLHIQNTQYFLVLQPLTFYLETKIKNTSSTFHEETGVLSFISVIQRVL